MKQKKVFYTTIFSKENKVNFLFSCLCILGISISEIFIAFLLQMLIDTAYSGNMNKLVKLLGSILIFTMVYGTILFAKRVFVNLYLEKSMSQYKSNIFSKILNKNIDSFKKESTSEYISAFSNDINFIEKSYFLGYLNIILQVLLLVGGIIAMLYLNWIIAICVLVISIIPVLISIAFGEKISFWEKRVSDENANYLALIKDLLMGFTTIKSFKAENNIYSIFLRRNTELEECKKESRKIRDLLEILINISSNGMAFVVFGLGAFFVIRNQITIGVVIAFVQLLNYISNPISILGPLIANKKAAEIIIKKHIELAEANEVNEGEFLIEGFNNEIRLEEVCFSYEKEKRIIDNISVTFEKNKSYAIVGESGSGKSTLLDLLLGYHNDYEGEITIDEQDLKDISKTSLYDNISIIQQDVFVFNSGIKDNISLFNNYDNKELDKVISLSGLSKFIEEKGEDYKCGENGSNLSGGEKQRISIARSLLRRTPILIMDEGVAALDNVTSYQIEKSILNIENLTKIIITHKLNKDILVEYDMIIVVKDGKIVETGDFEELIKKQGYFYCLYNITSYNKNDISNENIVE